MVNAFSTEHANNNYSQFFHRTQGMQMIKVLPGGLYCTNSNVLITTGLGSCIAVCMWDSFAEVGGMNHFLLPFHNQSEEHGWSPSQYLSTPSRYGTHAMEMLINALLSRGADRRRLQVKLFGGAQMHDHHATVGQKNVAFILKYVQQEGLDLVAKHLGGTEAKKVIFEPLTGRAWLKCIPFTEVRQVVREEDKYASRLDRESHRSHDDDVELF